MIVAIWNVNGIRARWGRFTEWLAERKPDAVALQELKVAEAELPAAELASVGYHAVALCQPGWNGVAVVARSTPEPSRLFPNGGRGLVGVEDAGARFVAACVGALEVVSVYVPNGKTLSHGDYKQKLVWLDRLAEVLEARADRDAPLVVMGDINVCQTDRDSFGGEKFRGKIFHTDDERGRIERIKRAGFVDLYRERYPEEPGFSCWDYRAGSFHKKEGMRIDLLLATPSVAARVTDVIVEREFRKKGKPSGSIPSDHAPVVAVLEG